jgi:arsenate reductase (thioredoxin)
MRVLFVCRGNVGRSQMAESIFNKLAVSELVSTSAGTKVFNKDGSSADGERLIDRDGAQDVLAVLLELGIDAANSVRKQVSQTMVEEADKVILMAEDETVPIYLKKSEKVTVWKIEDPKSKGLDETRMIRDQIKSLVENLVIELTR